MNIGAEDTEQQKIRLINTKDLKPHEHIDPKKLAEVKESIIKDGLRHPIIADIKTNIILDGHHRYNAFKKLDIKHIPVYYVNYENDNIILESWRDEKLTKQDIIDKAKKGEQYPIKTTKHMLMTKHGPRHISESIPQLNYDITK